MVTYVDDNGTHFDMLKLVTVYLKADIAYTLLVSFAFLPMLQTVCVHRGIRIIQIHTLAPIFWY